MSSRVIKSEYLTLESAIVRQGRSLLNWPVVPGNPFAGILIHTRTWLKSIFFNVLFYMRDRHKKRQQSEILMNLTVGAGLICNHCVHPKDHTGLKDIFTWRNKAQLQSYLPPPRINTVHRNNCSSIIDWLTLQAFLLISLPVKLIYRNLSTRPLPCIINRTSCVMSLKRLFKSQLSLEDIYVIFMRGLICVLKLMRTQQAPNLIHKTQCWFISRQVYFLSSSAALAPLQ